MPIMKVKKWAFHYDSCIKCNRNDRKHAGKGHCDLCYKTFFRRKYNTQWILNYRSKNNIRSYGDGFTYKATRSRPEKCEICNEIKKLVFDHCHTNHVFRGWICQRCNYILGILKDDIYFINKIILYLKN